MTRAALVLAGMLGLDAALAQETLERVEITGSSIKRAEAEKASPVQILTRNDIDKSGKTNLGEYLQTLTADGQGSVPTTFGRGFAGGSAAGISLRGLGVNATLVLVNGRRVAPAVLADDAERSFVDLNTIPLDAVDRVEVLKEGASVVYGPDAVAGVVNIILRKTFRGTVALASYGISAQGDGATPRVALLHGFGDLDNDGYNVLLNLDAARKDAIYYRDRAGRGTVGKSALYGLGFAPGDASGFNIPRMAGFGSIPVDPATGLLVRNAALPSIIGNVRYPFTGPLNAAGSPTDPNFGNYYSRGNPAGAGFTRTFSAAQASCDALANLPQNDPGQGCIADLRQQFGQAQPDNRNVNFFGRFTARLGDAEAYAELGLSKAESRALGGQFNVAYAPNGLVYLPDGSSASNAAATMLGANHPDNPYAGTAARLVYNPIHEIGPSAFSSSAHSERYLLGLKGNASGWDYDTAVLFSQSRQTDTAESAINLLVSNALLNPTAANVAAAAAASPAYAVLPAGTVWRIGENAALNSPAMYAALLANQTRDGFARNTGFDVKGTREVGQLDGGPIGVALGAEYRREENSLPNFTGLGSFIGLPLNTYAGSRGVFGAYAEALFPVVAQFEANAALRYDRYSDAGSSTTPRVALKWMPKAGLALRGAYSEAFRAPNTPESGPASRATFGGASVIDTARAGFVPADQLEVAPVFVQQGNPRLAPEKSRSANLGLVWDATSQTSFAADLWQIRRKGLIVLEDPQHAVDAGRVVRDPTTATAPGDPGAILNGYVTFINATQGLTSGIDVDLKHRFAIGAWGNVTLSASFTHLYTQDVTDADGTVHGYAGTHGNCMTTNCMGSPRDRANLAGSWDYETWRWAAILYYRGSMSNRLEAGAPCASLLADGSDAPAGCRIASFTTVDLSVLRRIGANTELFGSVQNLFDRVPPFDPLTYGAVGYNPLDNSGAVGRFYTVGLRHKF
jgi:iron complex outermembrane recepter protein